MFELSHINGTGHRQHQSARRLILAGYRQVRAATERLCEGLCAEDFVVQSMPDASPIKWHLAHTSWFFDNFVIAAAKGGRRVGPPAYNYLFNSYYNGAGVMHQRDRRGLLSRPTVAQVFAYRAAIDRRLAEVVECMDEDNWRQLESVIILGVNHEQQHQELILTDVKHLFAQNPLRPAYRAGSRMRVRSAQTAPLRWIRLEPGVHWIGSRPGAGFCFDHELPPHREFIERIELASRLVTNSEFSAFIDDGGYDRPELWLDAGWQTARREGWRAPLYWERLDGRWWSFDLCGMRPVQDAEPVCHVSYFEADAYARWAGARLPSETQWEAAAARLPLAGNFVESSILHPQACAGSAGLSQMFGDVWEWTASAYAPYPGYRPGAGTLGEYNGKFMCNQYVLRGGSCATPRSHIRAAYRNFFAPDKRWQFSGIRLARDL